jgi:hypothetical protein
MKTLLLLLLTASAACADIRSADYLTTKTVRYGANSEIIIQVKQHPEQEIEMVVIRGKNWPPSRVTIPSGNGFHRINQRVSRGWSVAIFTETGNQIDYETAMRKTGLGRIQ